MVIEEERVKWRRRESGVDDSWLAVVVVVAMVLPGTAGGRCMAEHGQRAGSGTV